jgi:AraC-like DNA-binding protein
MYQLTMTSLRFRHSHPDIAAAVFKADGALALRLAMAQQETSVDRIAIGQLLGRLYLAAGHQEEAEEVFHAQLRWQAALPKNLARWISTLDRAVMDSSLHRTGRAAALFNDVADDTEAPAPLRIEALCGLAVSLFDLGLYRRAQLSALEAHRLALTHEMTDVALVIRALQIDLELGGRLREPEPQSEALSSVLIEGRSTISIHDLVNLARAEAANLNATPLVAQRLSMLVALANINAPSAERNAAVRTLLEALRRSHMSCFEEAARIEAATCFIQQNDCTAATLLLDSALMNESKARRHPAAVDLLLCLSHVQGASGRLDVALRLFREHAQLRLQRLQRELPQVPYSRFLERSVHLQTADAIELKLPARYRKAYRFIVEHLKDTNLSIRAVASHLNVTERALQMAFRMHLGLSPAEFIRRQRMERIRHELMNGDSLNSTFEVAHRWGLGSRSTFTQHYRKQFGELPSSTARRSF